MILQVVNAGGKDGTIAGAKSVRGASLRVERFRKRQAGFLVIGLVGDDVRTWQQRMGTAAADRR